MNNYKITLTPLTPYFFGGEKTFGDDNANYYVKSNYLPQQTTILGFLRYELLNQNDLLGKDPVANNWAKLIGPTSFVEIKGVFTSDFGSISNISPVFLSNGKEHYICQALDWAMCDFDKSEKIVPIALDFIAKGNILTDSFRENIPVLFAGNKAYDPKLGTKSLWVKSDEFVMKDWDFDRTCESDQLEGRGFGNGLFISHVQTGIYRHPDSSDGFRKIIREKKDKGDFYKKISYTLADNMGFCFFIELNLPDNKKFETGERIVTMGGERSTFLMKVEPSATAGFDTYFNESSFQNGNNRKQNALILTSDAFVGAEILKNGDFSITDAVPFRNISTNQTAGLNYSKINSKKHSGGMAKSEKLRYLVKRGSIFYAEDLEPVKQMLLNPAFEKIGYNTFIEIFK